MPWCNQCIAIDEWLTKNKNLPVGLSSTYEFETRPDNTIACISCGPLNSAARATHGTRAKIVKTDVYPNRIQFVNERITPFFNNNAYLVNDDDKQGEKSQDLDTARRWLDRCDAEHVLECRMPPKFQLKLDSFFVDVKNRCIVKRKIEETKYVALSYVWGNSRVTKLESNNLNDMLKPHGLSDPRFPLSKAIEDAISATEYLGIDYLWCDCLCILQDGKDFQIYLNAMANIYAHAYVTFAITDAGSADQGIGGGYVDKNSPRITPRIIPFPNHKFRVGVPEADHKLFLDPWYTRGWTFQEGVFSRRIIIFNEDMQWVCPTSYEQQRGANLHQPYLETGQIWPIFRRDVCCNGKINEIHSYSKLLRQFIGRDLTTDTDIFKAFSGVLELASSTSQNPLLQKFFYSHPLAIFEDSLLWRRSPYRPCKVKRDLPTHETRQQKGTQPFLMPTWSCMLWKETGLDLSHWWYEDEHKQTIAKITKVCTACHCSVDIRDECSCVASNSLSSLRFSPYITLRTSRADLVVGPAGENNIALLDPTDGKTIVGEMCSDERFDIARTQASTANELSTEDPTEDRKKAAKLAFLAISAGKLHDTGSTYFCWPSNRSGWPVRLFVDGIYALCVKHDSEQPVSNWTRIGVAIIEKAHWDRLAGEESDYRLM